MGIFSVFAFTFLTAGSLQMFLAFPFLLMTAGGLPKILAQGTSGGSHYLPRPETTWAAGLALPDTFITSKSTIHATSAITSAASGTTPRAMINRAIADPGVLTISITNAYGTPLSLSYASNAAVDGTSYPPPIGNPTPAVLPPGAVTAIVYPTGWAGRITVGKVNTDQGSKIEGSTTGANDVDVSYVDGYTVPVTCSSLGVPVTGCNIELFNQNIACGGTLLDGGATCQNPKQGQPNGPASPFFAVCAGAAYTYPNDNDANNGHVDTTVTCCIGTSCHAPARQAIIVQQRDFTSSSLDSVTEEVLDTGKVPRAAGGSSLLPHLHKHRRGAGGLDMRLREARSASIFAIPWLI
ncbi:hypothetical protein MMC15_006662 [Xylographa vitiligo]|nr:hypothetical protein [Xylographa vitiligo]